MKAENENITVSDKEKIDKQKRKKGAKDYEAYIKQFTPKPKYFSNSIRAFFVGGGVCAGALLLENFFIAKGMPKLEAATMTTVVLVCTAQLLTGIGIFDTIARFAGAVIVPITGFANSMVAPAIEYKKEGLVLGVGSKLFSLAGPVLVCGIFAAIVVGLIKWLVASI